MKIAKITEFKDGKCIVMLKEGLMGEWYWGGEFDDAKKAKDFTKEEECTFTLVDKED